MNGTNAQPDLETLVANATDIRDIKPPLEIPNPWETVLYAAGVVVAVAVVYLLCLWWRKRWAKPRVAPPIPAHVRARMRLQEALQLISQANPFCTLVSDTVRHYLEERFRFRAPERTTEEFLHELQRTELLTRDQKESLGDFLTQCDLVKFARYEPGEAELKELHGSAVRLVEETEEKAELESRKDGKEPPPDLIGGPAIGNRKSQIVNSS
ncbi:MAG TPA: hypothetical protein PKA41_13385 [Verrucomicrobiota bacterium]|nr:hypothetical protein [Verrucomicrobiota bacterium]